jgi:tetratricopeptide (TPR) repeat protein
MRKILIIIGAILLLMVSLLTDWFVIPDTAKGAPDYIAATSKYQPYFKAAIVSVMLLFLFGIGSKLIKKHAALFYWALLILLLSYPHFVMIYDGEIASKATILSEQASMQVYETEVNFANIQTNWKVNYTKVIIPNEFKTMKTIVPRRDFFQLPHLERVLVHGTGFINAFFEFVHIGWIAGILGCTMLIFSSYLEKSPRFIADMKFIPFLLLLFIIHSVVPYCIGNFHLHRGDIYKSMGMYEQALSRYKRARKIVPVLDYNSTYHKAIGDVLLTRNQRDQWQYFLYTGDYYYGQKNFKLALIAYERCFDIEPTHPIAQIKLISLLINMANIQYNNAQYYSAMELWKRVVEIDDTNTLAHYGVMITGFHTGDFGRSLSSADKLIALQNFFQMKRITIVSQAYLHKSWMAFEEDKLSVAYDYYLKSINRDLWE